MKDKTGISKPKDLVSWTAQGIKVWREEARVLAEVKDIPRSSQHLARAVIKSVGFRSS